MVRTTVGDLNGIPGDVPCACVWGGRLYLCIICFALFIILCLGVLNWERPNHNESTASRLLSEVQHYRAWLVLRWGTTLESRVLFSLFLFYSKWPTPPMNFLTHNFTGMLTSEFLELSAALERTTQELSFPFFWLSKSKNWWSYGRLKKASPKFISITEIYVLFFFLSLLLECIWIMNS